MSRILLISNRANRQIALLHSICCRHNIPSRIIYMDEMPRVTLGDGGVVIGGRKVRGPGSGYQSGIRPDYFAAPDIPDGMANFSAFLDGQPMREQQLSHAMSMMAMLARTDGFRMVNEPMSRYDLNGQTALLLRMAAGGADVPELLLTNDYDSFLRSNLAEVDGPLWWSHPFANAPIKIIKKDKIKKLLESVREFPVQIMRPVEGEFIRLWYIDDRPLLIARQSLPEYSGRREGLEKFEYYAPNENSINVGKFLNNYIDGFYEIDGVIDEDGRLWVIRFDPDPCFTFLGDGGAEYLASKLIESLAGFAGIDARIDIEIPEADERTTLFLTRMIETLIATEQAAGEK
ncbi:MAG: hypothetical protein ACLFQX_08495 [Candidatus Kapaibacterium sp.]